MFLAMGVDVVRSNFRACDLRDLAGRQQFFIDGRVVVGGDGYFMAKDIACTGAGRD